MEPLKKIAREFFDESYYSIGLNRDPRYSQSLNLPTSHSRLVLNMQIIMPYALKSGAVSKCLKRQ